MHLRAPASRNMSTRCRQVVPRTMESSIITTRFPSTADRTAPRLEPDRLLPKILRRLDEGTAHIPVFDKAEPVRDSPPPGHSP